MSVNGDLFDIIIIYDCGVCIQMMVLVLGRGYCNRFPTINPNGPY